MQTPDCPTPLVIIEHKRDGKVTERVRFRGDPETFYTNLHLALADAANADVDECIIRVLRPTQE